MSNLLLKYQILKSDFDYISKENDRLRNQVENQARQIKNLKKRINNDFCPFGDEHDYKKVTDTYSECKCGERIHYHNLK